MEPGNRPYAGPGNAPGDVGTEEPTDFPLTPDRKGEAPLVPVRGGAIDEGVLDGSPADDVIEGGAPLAEPGGALQADPAIDA